MKIEQYDRVRLKDGRAACIIEVFSDIDFLADVGSSSEDWDTIVISIGDIEEIIKIDKH